MAAGCTFISNMSGVVSPNEGTSGYFAPHLPISVEDGSVCSEETAQQQEQGWSLGQVSEAGLHWDSKLGTLVNVITMLVAGKMKRWKSSL